MERPTPKPSQEQMASILAATDAERIRNMSLPESKPNVEEIQEMKEAGRQEYRDNKVRVIEHLKSRGLSNAAIAGIVGNIDVETGGSFDFMQRQTKSGNPRSPDIVEGGGYGLFQFDDPGRRAGHETWYKEYLEQTDKEDSAESQLDYFLDMVMSGSDTQSPFRKYAENLGPVHASTLKAYLETSTSPTDIADAITDRFEFPGKSHSDRRRATAEATFAELQPSDRVDADPNEQYLDQPGEIADTGEGAPMEEGSTFEYVPFLRHFMAEGGVPMKEQMELFDDGGLMDQGGTVDPVSGNAVPPGSTQEEVRDDIPAQLSEGEFVFPADVVRFIGLNNLMQMRQEAKMGLKQMEAMGQMGNSEEATMPDDLPFDINDLDIDDELEYNVGGFVPANQQQQQFGISGYQQAAAPTTGFAPAPVQAASAQFSQPARPQQVTTPMLQYQAPTVPFQQFIGGGVEGVEAETVQYKNEAGDIITRRINKATGELIPGQPAIPDGYTRYDPEAVEKEEVTTTPTTPQTTSVRETDTSDRDERRRKEEEMYGPGGGRLGVDGTIYGVSFDTAKKGLPGVGGALSIVGGLFSGKGLPEGATATIKRKGLEFTVTADEYNKLKSSIEKDGANSRATATIFEEIKQQALERKGTAAQQRFLDSLEKDTDDDDDAPKYSLTKQQLDDYAQSYAGVTDFSFDGGDMSMPTPKPSGSPPPLTKPSDIPSTMPRESSGDGREGYEGNQYNLSQPDPSRGEGSSDAARSYSMNRPTEKSTREDRFGEAGRFMKDGGLAAKKKPKVKKMKRGGLASKK